MTVDIRRRSQMAEISGIDFFKLNLFYCLIGSCYTGMYILMNSRVGFPVPISLQLVFFC